MKHASSLKSIFAIIVNLTCLSLLSFQTIASEMVPNSQAIKKAVLDTNDKMMEAENRLDADAFFSFILDSEQCTIIQNGTLFKNRQEAMQAVKKGFQSMSKMERKFVNPQVTVLSPEQALLTSEGTFSAMVSDGRTFEGRFAVSLVFILKSGQWKVLHGHYSVPIRP